MSRWTNFRRRSAADRWLLAEAAVSLLLVKATLLILPFRRIAARLGSSARETPAAALMEEGRDTALRVGWAVVAVARNLPWGFVCLPQAIAAKWMLRRRGIETTLYLGVRPQKESTLTAHAWLRAGDRILTGRRESRTHRAITCFGAPAEFSAELETLLALLRAALDPKASSAVAPAPSLALLRCVARHRVGAFLHDHLPESMRGALPASVLQGLARQASKNARRALAQAAELLEITRRLREEGIPCVSVKGPLLSQELYGSLTTRHAGDLDILIAREDLSRAESVLLARGYFRTRPQISLTERQMRSYAEKEFEFQGGAHGLRVELRWLLDGIGTLPVVNADAARKEFHGQEIAVPADVLNTIYLCHHGAIHGWRRLFWLVDIAQLFLQGEIDWAEVLRGARARGVERAVFEAAMLVKELLGVHPPPALTAGMKRKMIVRLARNAKKQIALPEAEVGRTSNFLRETTHRLLLHRGMRGKWMIFRPHFHSVRNWEDLPLPDAWFWLYVPFAPVLWARRRIWRRFRLHRAGDRQ